MTEKYHVVYSGWMIKSPPEKKLTGPWKIFRARWKKRYFVLSKPAQSLPGAYLLNYYSDENCKRVRGSIDLEQCAEIIESLDSDQFQYLLAIKTTHKSKDRTYFLATETEEQMTTWVRNLCTVCGMKPDETEGPTPQAPEREELPRQRPVQTVQPTTSLPATVGMMTKPSATVPTSQSRSGLANRGSMAGTQNNTNHVNNNLSSAHGTDLSATVPKPTATVQSVQSTQKHTVSGGAHNNNAERDSEYIPLETCTSGNSVKRANRQESVSSVPEEMAPPPPMLKPGLGGDFDNEVFQTYDVPPPTSGLEEDDLYKVPPSRPINMETLEAYDVPPPTRNSPTTPRSSSSESQKADSHSHSSQALTYDVPPVRLDGVGLTEDDVYDVPPSHAHSVSLNDVPPSRPPKPGHLQPTIPSQEAYMNLPTNSKMFSEKSNKLVDINSIVAPPPHAGMVFPTAEMSKMDIAGEMYDFPKSLHDNHANGDLSEKLLTSTPPPPTVCGSNEHRYINAAGRPVEADMYLPMDPVSDVGVKPRKSSSTDNEVEYTDMSGKSSFDDSFEGPRCTSVYDVPPPSRPAMPPPRPVKPAIITEGVEKQDTYSIFSTNRTRSFKRKNLEESPRVQRKTSPAPKSSLAKSAVPLPQRLDRHPDFSTSDEDDEDMGSPDVWGTTPPAPGNKDTELKYVDLEHDESTDKEPMRSPHSGTAPVAHTEYHEIDFVKTDALKSVKENVAEERNKEKNHS